MKKSFSKEWVSSTQPRKQRKYRHNAPLHLRSKMLGSPLSKDLRKQSGRRSIRIRVGDEVRVVRGSFKGYSGAISKIDIKKLKVYVDGVNANKANQQEVPVMLDPSNLVITKINLDDKKRKRNVYKNRPESDTKVKKEVKSIKKESDKKIDAKKAVAKKNDVGAVAKKGDKK